MNIEDKKEWFKENSSVKTKTIKKFILKYKILKYECSECKISSWNNKPISLHLDHKNGKNKDYRIENLRFLCPNCHSLTDTYGSKNYKIIKKIKIKAPAGWRNRPKLKLRKVVRPSKEDLQKMIEKIPMVKIAKKYGISDVAVKKWCKRYGIIIENRRGYWAKKYAKTKK